MIEMNIKKFDSIEELFKQIDNDKISFKQIDNRFPIRFIFLNSFKELKEIVKFLSNRDTEIEEINKCLSSENSWLTPSEILDFTNNSSKNSVILPISEFLRFSNENEFYTTLKSLTEIELEQERIYIPLVGLWERFEQNFWTNFFRNDEWAPIWKLETNSKKIHIYQINYDINLTEVPEEFKLVSSTNEWFDIWKEENVKNIISLSKPLSLFYRNCLPDQTFYLDIIPNSKEYLNNILGININIEFKEKETKFWNELLKKMSEYKTKESSLKEIFLNHFNLGNIDNFTSKDFMSLYLKTDNQFDHWLIKNFILNLDKFKSTYLYFCFKNLEKLKNIDLIDKIWTEIFKIPHETIEKSNYYERKDLLKISHDDYNYPTNEKIIHSKLEKIKNFPPKHQFMYLTNITHTEKKFILETIENDNISTYLSDLKVVYPELYYYLDWNLIKPDIEIDSWLIEYLKEYNISKINFTKSKKLENLINDHNKDKSTFSKWFYDIPTVKIETDYHPIWVDGLGAEWFPLLVHLIKEYGKSVKKKMITRINLPTNTECNKYKFEKIEKLDKFIHNQNVYRHPDTLIEELEIVKKIIIKILDKSHDKICIISDHGFSFLCLKEFGNIKRLDFENTEHEGRYKWSNGENYKDDNYFFTWDVDEGNCKNKNVVIASKHVSLSKTPHREVHGGATPEEVLVPYILVETKKEDKVEYNIQIVEFEIPISNPILKFTISPKPLDIPEAFFNEMPLKLSIEKNNLYNVDLNSLKVGKHLISLIIGKNRFKYNINIKGGFIERDLI